MNTEMASYGRSPRNNFRRQRILKLTNSSIYEICVDFNMTIKS